jgi:hypothetical protein
MTVVPLTEVYASAHLVGFWQFAAGGGNYLAVLERDAGETRSELTLLQLADGRWKVLKKIANQDTSIRAVDGYPIGADLVFGLETNDYAALRIVRADLKTFLDPARKDVQFTPVAEIAPTEAQIQKIQLPVTKRWHVPTPLAPPRWLFSPQVVRGVGMPVQLIANAADGHAMIFTPQPEPDLEAFSIPNAAEPQAHVVYGRRVAAFKRYGEPYFPYWSLPQYSGGRMPKSGELMVATSDSTRNLSRELSIGPVPAFRMAAAPDNRLWIFVLSDAPVGTDVLALTQRGSEWTVEGRWSVDEELQGLSAEYGFGRWQLVYSEPAARGWSLKYQTWR